MIVRPDRHGAHGRAHAIDPRHDERRAVRREDVEIDLLVAGVDRRDDRVVGARRNMRRRERGQCRETDCRLSRCKRDAARRRDADAQAGEAARPDRYGDAINVGKFAARLIHHARDHRHDRFGVAALHGDGFAREDRAGLRIEHGCRAGSKRGVDRQNSH